jgi:Holliday junction resolvase
VRTLQARNRSRGIGAEHRGVKWLRDRGLAAVRVPMSGAGAMNGDIRAGVVNADRLIIDWKITEQKGFRVTEDLMDKVNGWGRGLGERIGLLIIQFAESRRRWVVMDAEDLIVLLKEAEELRVERGAVSW